MSLQTQIYEVGDYAYQSWSNSYVISLTLTEESIDTSNNTSLVSYLFTISNTDNNRFWSNDYSWAINIGGHTISINNFNFDLTENFTTQTITSGQITVVHNADGTLDMPFNVAIPDYIQTAGEGNIYAPPAMSIVGEMSLTPIVISPTAIPTIFNGVQLNSIVFNGQSVSHLVFNGTTIF